MAIGMLLKKGMTKIGGKTSTKCEAHAELGDFVVDLDSDNGMSKCNQLQGDNPAESKRSQRDIYEIERQYEQLDTFGIIRVELQTQQRQKNSGQAAGQTGAALRPQCRDGNASGYGVADAATISPVGGAR